MKDMKTIVKVLRRDGFSTKAVNKLMSVAEQFATPEAFFSATKGTLMAVASKMERADGNGGKTKGCVLGKKFFEVYDAALVLWKSPEAANNESGRAAPPALASGSWRALSDHAAPVGPAALWLGLKLSVADIKKVLDFMEMFSVKSLGFEEVARLLDLTKSAEPEAKEEAAK